MPTNEWLHDFMGRNILFSDFETLATDLTADLNVAMGANEIRGDLTIHLGGFEELAASGRRTTASSAAAAADSPRRATRDRPS